MGKIQNLLSGNMLSNNSAHRYTRNVPNGTLFHHHQKTILVMYRKLKSSLKRYSQSSSKSLPDMSSSISVSIIGRIDRLSTSIKGLLKRSKHIKLLESYGSFESALADFSNHLPDIVLINSHSSDMPSTNQIHTLRQKFPSVQILLTTTNADKTSIIAMFQAGVSGYILRPVPTVRILAAITELAAGDIPMSPQVARTVVQSLWRPEAPQKAKQHLKSLSKREKDVLELLSKGFGYSEIAEQLGIQRGTVQRHLHSIYAKMNVRTRAESTHLYLSR